jgi:MFS family permease
VIITQILAMLQAFALSALVLTGHAQLWQLVVLSAFLGIITAFDLPSRQTFLVDMLDSREQLPGAISINSSINTLTRLVGPFVAGLFISWTGEGICFLVNALSYVAVVVALFFVKANQPPQAKHKQKPMAQLKEGFTYAFGFPPIRALLLFLALIGLFSMPITVLMPAFAKDIFHGNAATLGFLTAASSAGSVLGAVFLGSRKGPAQILKLLLAGFFIFGLGLLGFGLSTSMIWSLPMLVATGFGGMVVLAGSNTLLQTIVEEDKRGRVMSIFIMTFLGLAPFGCMVAGALAGQIGASTTVVISGVITVILGFAFWLQCFKSPLRGMLTGDPSK